MDTELFLAWSILEGKTALAGSENDVGKENLTNIVITYLQVSFMNTFLCPNVEFSAELRC